MAQLFFNTPTCTIPETTVSGCISKLNFFDRAYALDGQSQTDCNGNATTSQLRDFTIYDTIICGEGEDQNMWGIIDQMFGKSEMAINSTSAWRKSECRPNYSFKIKDSAQSGSPGAPVTVTLSQDSHYLGGTSSLPIKGAPVMLPGINFTYGIITDKNTDVPYAHTITITPPKKTGTGSIIVLNANQRLFFGAGARLEKGGSCPDDQTTVNLPGKLQRTQMALIRADWCIEKEINMGYDGVLQFALGLVDGKVVNCWDAIAAQMKRKAMKITRDQLLLVGNYMSNPALQVQVQGYEGFEGYIPSVLNGGGIDLTFDPFTGFNMFGGMRAISRFADANRRCKDYTWFVSPEFRRGITDSWNATVSASGLGVCNYEAFTRTGISQSTATEFLGYESFKVDDINAYIKTLPYLADNTAYGIQGYAFNNMAMIMPMCPIRTVSGKTASPIEIFYPETQCDSGGYTETMVDEWKTTRCMKVAGSMYQQFAAMYHCVEDHAIVRASVC